LLEMLGNFLERLVDFLTNYLEKNLEKLGLGKVSNLEMSVKKTLMEARSVKKESEMYWGRTWRRKQSLGKDLYLGTEKTGK